jgi:hypothetical protein
MRCLFNHCQSLRIICHHQIVVSITICCHARSYIMLLSTIYEITTTSLDILCHHIAATT